MDNELRKMINEFAEAILTHFKITTPISDMEEVVSRLGGLLREEEGIGLYSDGRIQKVIDEDSDIDFVITVPMNQSINRKNFTVAHELGHLFLHMGYMTNQELWQKANNKVFNRSGNSESEIQANEFAAAFLMPRQEYKEIMDMNSEGNTVFIGKVADYFKVSIDAASYRGKWLGYLQW